MGENLARLHLLERPYVLVLVLVLARVLVR